MILYNLSPADFHSARHTCRLWFSSSMDRTLLRTMLRRAGFSDSASSDGEWLLSKRLIREYALGPDWRVYRNGFRGSPFVPASTVDFTDIETHYPGPDLVGTACTVSSCGRFLMVANGCLVYIYELNRSHHTPGYTNRPGLLRPVTSVICPRRVLACSMDTSSERYAIAILLDGRMGLVCDITALNQDLADADCSTAGDPQRAFQQSGGNSPSNDACSSASYHNRTSSVPVVSYLSSGTARRGSSSQRNRPAWHDVRGTGKPVTSRTIGSESCHGSCSAAYMTGLDVKPQDLSLPDGTHRPTFPAMPVEYGIRSLYRSLCSDDDPPRSVAICPQRRCVAFGCSSGIELHWVDAPTGQDLNRWFPLTAPSDYLFFLPPRKSVDSAKKLRLISSAGRPSERPSMSGRAFGSRSQTSPFWERIGWGLSHFDYEQTSSPHGILTRLRIDASRSTLVGRMDCSDHYRAVPLSDVKLRKEHRGISLISLTGIPYSLHRPRLRTLMFG